MLAPNLVPAYGRGLRAAIDEVAALVDARAPVDLCGLSLGAIVALHVAADCKVRRLVVCAAADRLPRTVQRRIRALAAVIGFAPGRLVKRQLVAALPEPHRSDALTEIALLRPRQVSRLLREAAASEAELREIGAPTLVLCGERDKANHPQAHALAEALPKATLKLVPNAGHVANLDNPYAFTRVLREFLELVQVSGIRVAEPGRPQPSAWEEV